MNSARLFRRICGAVAIGYFLLIAWPSFTSRWAPDDPMNLYNYWHLGLPRILGYNFLFFTSAYRPLGGLFYLPIFRFAHLNPFPYHMVLDVVLGINTWLLYRFARLLGVPGPAAGFAALLSCSHVAMIQLFLWPSDSYDAFCFLFYFGALVYYVRIRSAGFLLTGRQKAVFAVLYVCALNAKEIGVTLPALAAVYEFLYYGKKTKRITVWIRKEGQAIAICAVLGAAYTAGKMLGHDSLAALAEYKPEVSVQRFVNNNAHFLDDLIYTMQPWFGAAGLGCSWVAAGLYAWLRGKLWLKFCWFFVILTPLPIAVIPQRGLYNLYLPLAGWAILVCCAAWDAICVITSTRWLPARGAFVARLVLSVLLISVWTRDRMWRASFSVDASRQMQDLTWDTIRQFRALNVQIPHGSRVVFLHDPFQAWDLFFIANLCYNDPSLQFLMQRYMNLPESEIEKMDYVFDWKDGRIVLVRSKPA